MKWKRRKIRVGLVGVGGVVERYVPATPSAPATGAPVRGVPASGAR